MQERGNKVANSFWECVVPKDLYKPSPQASSSEKAEWIIKKYIKREFIHPKSSTEDIEKMIFGQTFNFSWLAEVDAFCASSAHLLYEARFRNSEEAYLQLQSKDLAVHESPAKKEAIHQEKDRPKNKRQPSDVTQPYSHELTAASHQRHDSILHKVVLSLESFLFELLLIAHTVCF